MNAPGNLFGKAHHKPAHDEGEILLGAVLANFLLNFGKGDDVNRQPTAPHRQKPCQLQHLVLRLLGGIGRRDKVDHFQLHAPAGHHPRGHRRVNSAGQKAHRRAAHADGQAPRAWGGGRVDISSLFPNLHMHRQIRLVNVHGHIWEPLPQKTAHGLRNLNGIQVKQLVRPLGLHLEGPRRCKFLFQIRRRRFKDGVHVLFAGNGPGHIHHAEHLTTGGQRLRHVAVLSPGLHVNGALAQIHVEAAAAAQAAADIAHQLVFKGPAVQPLQDHLAQLQQENFPRVLVCHKTLRLVELKYSGKALIKNTFHHSLRFDRASPVSGWQMVFPPDEKSLSPLKSPCCGTARPRPDGALRCAPIFPNRRWCGPPAVPGRGTGR
ncbi:hypothetical protein SDC9_70822 [bioreactor metagenome]|uniref:Uncharacterized protein n=1 Tax=bioreactor metagenome TaxID=1076179 RepID=A0A644Y7A4_9ZZZZ